MLKTRDSVARGVSDILRGIAKDIGTGIGTPYSDLDAIDWVMRSGKSPMAYVNRLRLLAHEGLLAQGWTLVSASVAVGSAAPTSPVPIPSATDLGDPALTKSLFTSALQE